MSRQFHRTPDPKSRRFKPPTPTNIFMKFLFLIFSILALSTDLCPAQAGPEKSATPPDTKLPPASVIASVQQVLDAVPADIKPKQDKPWTELQIEAANNALTAAFGPGPRRARLQVSVSEIGNGRGRPFIQPRR